MKKTLITLLALGGFSHGLTLTQGDITGYVLNDAESYTNWTTDFDITLQTNGDMVFSDRPISSLVTGSDGTTRTVTTVAITLDASKLTTPTSTSPLLTLDGSGADIGIGLNSDRKATTMWIADSATPNYAYFTVNNVLASTGTITLTMSFTNDGTTLYTPDGYNSDSRLKGALGSITSMTLSSYAVDALEAITVYAGTGNLRDTAVYNSSVSLNASIPEPTTATLSLLALAGLCARRRR